MQHDDGASGHDNRTRPSVPPGGTEVGAQLDLTLRGADVKSLPPLECLSDGLNKRVMGVALWTQEVGQVLQSLLPNRDLGAEYWKAVVSHARGQYATCLALSSMDRLNYSFVAPRLNAQFLAVEARVRGMVRLAIPHSVLQRDETGLLSADDPFLVPTAETAGGDDDDEPPTGNAQDCATVSGILFTVMRKAYNGTTRQREQFLTLLTRPTVTKAPEEVHDRVIAWKSLLSIAPTFGVDVPDYGSLLTSFLRLLEPLEEAYPDLGKARWNEQYTRGLSPEDRVTRKDFDSFVAWVLRRMRVAADVVSARQPAAQPQGKPKAPAPPAPTGGAQPHGGAHPGARVVPPAGPGAKPPPPGPYNPANTECARFVGSSCAFGTSCRYHHPSKPGCCKICGDARHSYQMCTAPGGSAAGASRDSGKPTHPKGAQFGGGKDGGKQGTAPWGWQQQQQQ